MKKLLAIVLALAMVLSMGVASFAYEEVAQGQIYLGMAQYEYQANPGDEVTLGFRYAGNPFESDGYPTTGYAIIPFMGFNNDVNALALTSAALTAEAEAAGFKFVVNENSGYHSYLDGEQGIFAGAIIFPMSEIATDITVFTITGTVSTDWVVVDYVEEAPIDLEIYAGFDGVGFDSMIVSEEDGAKIIAGELTPEECAYSTLNGVDMTSNSVIVAMPYQPTTMEILEEQFKGIALALLEVLGIGIGLLKGELAPADWYNPEIHEVIDLSFITDGIASLVGSLLG